MSKAAKIVSWALVGVENISLYLPLNLTRE